jgi:hypothetical protein
LLQRKFWRGILQATHQDLLVCLDDVLNFRGWGKSGAIIGCFKSAAGLGALWPSATELDSVL